MTLLDRIILLTTGLDGNLFVNNFTRKGRDCVHLAPPVNLRISFYKEEH